MKESEAIARIKASRDYRYSHYAYTDDNGKAFDMAIQALEKQELEKRKSDKTMRVEVAKLIDCMKKLCDFLDGAQLNDPLGERQIGFKAQTDQYSHFMNRFTRKE